jgi:hypothetical protein
VLSGHSLPNFKRWTRWSLGHNFRPQGLALTAWGAAPLSNGTKAAGG